MQPGSVDIGRLLTPRAATPEQIAPLYWDLHERRDRPEVVFNG